MIRKLKVKNLGGVSYILDLECNNYKDATVEVNGVNLFSLYQIKGEKEYFKLYFLPILVLKIIDSHYLLKEFCDTLEEDQVVSISIDYFNNNMYRESFKEQTYSVELTRKGIINEEINGFFKTPNHPLESERPKDIEDFFDKVHIYDFSVPNNVKDFISLVNNGFKAEVFQNYCTKCLQALEFKVYSTSYDYSINSAVLYYKGENEENESKQNESNESLYIETTDFQLFTDLETEIQLVIGMLWIIHNRALFGGTTFINNIDSMISPEENNKDAYITLSTIENLLIPFNDETLPVQLVFSSEKDYENIIDLQVSKIRSFSKALEEDVNQEVFPNLDSLKYPLSKIDNDKPICTW